MKLEQVINKYLDISTGHLPQTEWDALSGHEWVVFVQHDYGGFVNVSNISEIAGDLPVLAKILQIAEEYDCNWVNFDCDAGKVDDLPTFEWEP